MELQFRDIISIAALLALPIGACWALIRGKIDDTRHTAQAALIRADAVHTIVLSEFVRTEEMHRTIRTAVDPVIDAQRRSHELLMRVAAKMHIPAVGE